MEDVVAVELHEASGDLREEANEVEGGALYGLGGDGSGDIALVHKFCDDVVFALFFV